MTISSQVVRNNYTGTSLLSTYSYSFRAVDEEDLLVTVRDLDGVETTLTLATDYTITGENESSGGTIVLVSSGQAWLTTGKLTTGFKLTIRRKMDLVQATDIRNQGEFLPEIHEDEFDYLVMADQQQQDEINRAVKFPETCTIADFDPSLPIDMIGAESRVFGTNADGDGFETGPTFTEISNAQQYALDAEDAMDTAVASAAAAAASEASANGSELAAATAQAASAASQAAASASAAAASASEVAAAISAAAAATSLVWTKVSIDHNTISTAANSAYTDLKTLAAREVVHGIMLKHSEAFAGTGITTLTLNVGYGSSTNDGRYVSDYDGKQAVSDSVSAGAQAFDVLSFASTVKIRLKTVSTGNMLDNLTAGAVDVWILSSVMP